MLKVTQKQIDKHDFLNSHNNRGREPVKLPEVEIVPESEAQNIGAVYGTIYICILPDGSSHS